jgi:hypothetical protein
LDTKLFSIATPTPNGIGAITLLDLAAYTIH